jgi:hypothetical protein
MDKDVTVKELINKLLECDMDSIIIIRDREGKQLRDISINARPQTGMVCLFG